MVQRHKHIIISQDAYGIRKEGKREKIEIQYVGMHTCSTRSAINKLCLDIRFHEFGSIVHDTNPGGVILCNEA